MLDLILDTKLLDVTCHLKLYDNKVYHFRFSIFN